jgi:DNA-binding IclR family transcriptional regulator
MPAQKQSPATAVERALGILEAIARAANGLTNSEISRALGIPKSTASYILHCLERRGYLRRESPGGKYRLGLKVLDLSQGLLKSLDLRELARPVLSALVQRVHLTTHLAVLENGEAVYIERAEAPGFIKMDTWVGRRMFVHSTSVGKVLVAWRPKDEVEQILTEHGMKKRTPKTISVAAKYMLELERVRTEGYGLDDEENSVGARCIAAPVFNGRGQVEAAIGVSGTIAMVNADTSPKIIAAVKDAAQKISAQLGYSTHPSGAHHA